MAAFLNQIGITMRTECDPEDPGPSGGPGGFFSDPPPYLATSCENCLFAGHDFCISTAYCIPAGEGLNAAMSGLCRDRLDIVADDVGDYDVFVWDACPDASHLVLSSAGTETIQRYRSFSDSVPDSKSMSDSFSESQAIHAPVTASTSSSGSLPNGVTLSYSLTGSYSTIPKSTSQSKAIASSKSEMRSESFTETIGRAYITMPVTLPDSQPDSESASYAIPDSTMAATRPAWDYYTASESVPATVPVKGWVPTPGSSESHSSSYFIPGTTWQSVVVPTPGITANTQIIGRPGYTRINVDVTLPSVDIAQQPYYKSTIASARSGYVPAGTPSDASVTPGVVEPVEPLWILGELGQSCDDVCSPEGGASYCSENFWPGSAADMMTVAGDACIADSAEQKDWNPSILDGTCFWDSAAFACDASDASARRLCPCLVVSVPASDLGWYTIPAEEDGTASVLIPSVNTESVGYWPGTTSYSYSDSESVDASQPDSQPGTAAFQILGSVPASQSVAAPAGSVSAFHSGASISYQFGFDAKDTEPAAVLHVQVSAPISIRATRSGSEPDSAWVVFSEPAVTPATMYVPDSASMYTTESGVTASFETLQTISVADGDAVVIPASQSVTGSIPDSQPASETVSETIRGGPDAHWWPAATESVVRRQAHYMKLIGAVHVLASPSLGEYIKMRNPKVIATFKRTIVNILSLSGDAPDGVQENNVKYIHAVRETEGQYAGDNAWLIEYEILPHNPGETYVENIPVVNINHVQTQIVDHDEQDSEDFWNEELKRNGFSESDYLQIQAFGTPSIAETEIIPASVTVPAPALWKVRVIDQGVGFVEGQPSQEPSWVSTVPTTMNHPYEVPVQGAKPAVSVVHKATSIPASAMASKSIPSFKEAEVTVPAPAGFIVDGSTVHMYNWEKNSDAGEVGESYPYDGFFTVPWTISMMRTVDGTVPESKSVPDSKPASAQPDLVLHLAPHWAPHTKTASTSSSVPHSKPAVQMFWSAPYAIPWSNSAYQGAGATPGQAIHPAMSFYSTPLSAPGSSKSQSYEITVPFTMPADMELVPDTTPGTASETIPASDFGPVPAVKFLWSDTPFAYPYSNWGYTGLPDNAVPGPALHGTVRSEAFERVSITGPIPAVGTKSVPGQMPSLVPMDTLVVAMPESTAVEPVFYGAPLELTAEASFSSMPFSYPTAVFANPSPAFMAEPTPEAADFSFGSANALLCPDTFETIALATTCERAAGFLNKLYRDAGVFPNAPPGCFYSEISDSVHFNAHPEGMYDFAYRPVCVYKYNLCRCPNGFPAWGDQCGVHGDHRCVNCVPDHVLDENNHCEPKARCDTFDADECITETLRVNAADLWCETNACNRWVDHDTCCHEPARCNSIGDPAEFCRTGLLVDEAAQRECRGLSCNRWIDSVTCCKDIYADRCRPTHPILSNKFCRTWKGVMCDLRWSQVCPGHEDPFGDLPSDHTFGEWRQEGGECEDFCIQTTTSTTSTTTVPVSDCGELGCIENFHFFGVHAGHCRTGWLGTLDDAATTEECAAKCFNVVLCAYFSFTDLTELPSCALYGAEGCLSDRHFPEYMSYAIARRSVGHDSTMEWIV
jgi:hypothetical protein